MSSSSFSKVAIVGAGPSGLYAAAELLRLYPNAQVDLFERLYAPHGLVRYGVAPDHARIKAVTKAFDRIAADPRIHFRGNVCVGRDVSVSDLRASYTAVLFAHGASQGRGMNIPGVGLENVFTAVDFVGWYNTRPGFDMYRPDFSHPVAVVVGNGNVALDVARILARPAEDWATTDISNAALEALRKSAIRRVVVIGRRGPAQAAFTPVELKEFRELPGLVLKVHPDELHLATEDREEVESDATTRIRQCMSEFERMAAPQEKSHAERVVEFRFQASPVAMEGDGRVTRVVLGRNTLQGPSGERRAVDSGEREILDAGLVIGAIGYLGLQMDGLPFDTREQVIPSDLGRVSDMPGVYCAGWIRRGAQGVIGTAKRDAMEVAAVMAGDLPHLPAPPDPGRVNQVLAENGCREISWADWQVLDGLEMAAGKKQNRPRIKFSSNEEVLAYLG